MTDAVQPRREMATRLHPVLRPVLSPVLARLLPLAALALLAACAQPARVSQMTVPNILAPVVADNPDLQHSMSVAEVSGGKGTSPLWTSQVDNPEFKEALERSLEFNGILAPDADKARYAVSVTLKELHQPLMGLDLTVTPHVHYRVVDRSSAAEILNEEMETPFTANFSSSLIAVERLRLANEGGVRESIKLFLTRLGEAWTTRKTGGPAVAPATAPAGTTVAGKPTS